MEKLAFLENKKNQVFFPSGRWGAVKPEIVIVVSAKLQGLFFLGSFWATRRGESQVHGGSTARCGEWGVRDVNLNERISQRVGFFHFLR